MRLIASCQWWQQRLALRRKVLVDGVHHHAYGKVTARDLSASVTLGRTVNAQADLSFARMMSAEPD